MDSTSVGHGARNAGRQGIAALGALVVALFSACRPGAPPPISDEELEANLDVQPMSASGAGSAAGTTGEAAPAASVSPTPEPTPEWLFLETGDLSTLRSRGVLRILMPRQGDAGYLPRNGFPLDEEREIADDFARENGLEPVWVYVDNHDELVPWLLEGKGDLIAANLTQTEARKKRISFTVPLSHVREQLVTRAEETALKKPAQLGMRRVALRRSSSFWETMTQLKKKVPSMILEEVPESVDTEEILDGVASGTYDLTVADSNLLTAVFGYRDDLRVAFDVSGDRVIAWGVRPGAKALKGALDRFLNHEKLVDRKPAVYAEDLPGLKKRKTLRMLTRNSSASYFLWRGEVLGFEYELARNFAKAQGLRLEVVVPPNREDLLNWLDEGKGDFVAASMTRTPEREAAFGVSRPYNQVSEVVVARASEKKVKKEKDLAGRTFVVRRSSSYWGTLERLKASGVEITLQAAPEEMETEEIIAKVASGEYDLTLADSPILDIERTWRDDVVAAFPIGEPVSYGWLTRKKDAKLVAAIDAYFKEEVRGTAYNLAYRRYFKDSRRIRTRVEDRVEKAGELSPYDDLIRRYALQYGFDWRLIASQMYQESRFNPDARSWVGAIGLMQVMPRTALEMGFKDVRPPEAGIHAGIKYLAWVRDRHESDLSVKDRTWFSLAAYNAGLGHVIDARALAKKRKLDPNRWFGNVEQAMLLLEKPYFARRARFGYCRGQEPVDYVRKIRDRYEAYLRAAPPDRLARRTETAPAPPPTTAPPGPVGAR